MVTKQAPPLRSLAEQLSPIGQDADASHGAWTDARRSIAQDAERSRRRGVAFATLFFFASIASLVGIAVHEGRALASLVRQRDGIALTRIALAHERARLAETMRRRALAAQDASTASEPRLATATMPTPRRPPARPIRQVRDASDRRPPDSQHRPRCAGPLGHLCAQVRRDGRTGR